ncbi:unnamed protein product [Lactuca virosa]|uniref:Uncharacterized protein n=1 Tax=Lactuca virosa TaxID=75947 RepID=A0AAU9PG84_9ASTR|nr:unnamed protein product [Lactuca virosa]
MAAKPNIVDKEALLKFIENDIKNDLELKGRICSMIVETYKEYEENDEMVQYITTIKSSLKQMHATFFFISDKRKDVRVMGKLAKIVSLIDKRNEERQERLERLKKE